MKPMIWMRAIRDAEPKPTATRLLVLWSLALRMNADGTGFASSRQLAQDTSVHPNTVGRATKWAREADYLVQTRRGHRLGSGGKVASEWLLTAPAQHTTGGELREISTHHEVRLNTPPVVHPEVLHPEVFIHAASAGSAAADQSPLSRAQRDRRADDLDVDKLVWELEADFEATGYLANNNWVGDTEELVNVALGCLRMNDQINDEDAWLAAALKHMSPVGKAARLLELVGDEPDE